MGLEVIEGGKVEDKKDDQISCKNCKFSTLNNGQPICRRYPMTTAIVKYSVVSIGNQFQKSMQTVVTAEQIASSFPVVGADVWCGEHKPLDTEPVSE